MRKDEKSGKRPLHHSTTKSSSCCSARIVLCLGLALVLLLCGTTLHSNSSFTTYSTSSSSNISSDNGLSPAQSSSLFEQQQPIPTRSGLRFFLDKTRPTTTSALNTINIENNLPLGQTQVSSSTQQEQQSSAVPKKGGKQQKPKPLCRRYLIRAGQWLPVTAPTHAVPYHTSVQHLRCYDESVYRQVPYPHTHRWIPDAAMVGECTFDSYDATQMCRLLPRATIAIVGDSLSWEQYRSLVSLHSRKTHQGYQQQSYELHTTIQQTLCKGMALGSTIPTATTVLYRRDDYLRELDAVLSSKPQNDQQDRHFPTVLILNRGAHYVPDEELLVDIRKVIQQVRRWLTRCEEDYEIQCHFFWRTTVPGHLGCNDKTNNKDDNEKKQRMTTKTKSTNPIRINMSMPMNDLATMEALVEDVLRYDNVTIEYHWHDFRRQNELVLKEFVKAELSNFQVIDAYHLNILRPDEHRVHQNDCLHSCFPGKMDVYNQLLLHFLKMQRSTNDIKRLIQVAADNDWPARVVDTPYTPNATAAARLKRQVQEASQLQLLTPATTTTTTTATKSTTTTASAASTGRNDQNGKVYRKQKRNVNDDDEESDDEDGSEDDDVGKDDNNDKRRRTTRDR